MDDGPVRVGLVGYGSAGRGIHAPLLREAGLEIRLVVTSDAGRRRQLAEEAPGAEAVDTPDELFGRPEDVDLVVLASPSGVHVEQATKALDAGLPVVAANPLPTDAARVGGQQAPRHGRRERARARPARRPRRRAADRVPEPSLGRRAAHPARAAP